MDVDPKEYPNDYGTLVVRYVANDDTNLLDSINKLLKHNKRRDGDINFLGRGVPKVNNSWLKQNGNRKIVAIWKPVVNDSSQKNSSNQVLIAGVSTLIMPSTAQKTNKSAILELIKTNKDVVTNMAVGQKLMKFAEAICENAIKEIRVNVEERNRKGIIFFNSLNFEADKGRQAKNPHKTGPGKELCYTLRRDDTMDFMTEVPAENTKKTKKRKRSA